MWQVFYESFDEDFEGRWVVSQNSEYGGIHRRVPFHLDHSGMGLLYGVGTWPGDFVRAV